MYQSISEGHTAVLSELENGQAPVTAQMRENPRRYGRSSYMVLKRVVDVVCASLGLLVLLPFFLIVSAFIIATDGMPIVFRQSRVGRHGKEFKVFKFRTMVNNAEEVLKRDPALYAEYQKNFKLENDPRITKIGNFLRKTSMDELPQLLNVVRGEMSLVGPRPILNNELVKYGDHQDVYLEMLPGCAGLWQCSGRSDTSYEERVSLDAEYYRKAGIRMDLWIMYRTFISILKREGAQ